MFKKSSKNYLRVITLIVITLLFALLLTSCDDSNIKKYKITVTSNNASLGTVSGGGTYKEGATATLRATSKKNNLFTGWYNGQSIVASDATYKFTVTEDLTLIGHFGPMDEEINDFNVFVETISNTFKDSVGLDTLITTTYEDQSESLNIKAHYENGEITSAYLNASDYYKVWIKDGIQYNYNKYSNDEEEANKHTFDKNYYINSFYMHGYMIQLLNQLISDDEIEYVFNYNNTSKIYTIDIISDDDGDDSVQLELKVINNQLVESSFEIKYDNTQTMTLVEKLYYDKATRPVIPAIEEHDFIEMYWITTEAPTGDSTKYYSTVREIPSYLYDDYFDESNIEGYYYDKAFTKKANIGDVLTRDTTVYYKLIDDEKIDFTINFANAELTPIILNQVYKGQIIEVGFPIPEDVDRSNYIDSLYNQIRDSGIDVTGSNDYDTDILVIWIVMPSETKTITIE